MKALQTALLFLSQKDFLIAVLFSLQAAVVIVPEEAVRAPRWVATVDLVWAAAFLLLASLRAFKVIPPPGAPIVPPPPPEEP